MTMMMMMMMMIMTIIVTMILVIMLMRLDRCWKRYLKNIFVTVLHHLRFNLAVRGVWSGAYRLCLIVFVCCCFAFFVFFRGRGWDSLTSVAPGKKKNKRPEERVWRGKKEKGERERESVSNVQTWTPGLQDRGFVPCSSPRPPFSSFNAFYLIFMWSSNEKKLGCYCTFFLFWFILIFFFLFKKHDIYLLNRDVLL